MAKRKSSSDDEPSKTQEQPDEDTSTGVEPSQEAAEETFLGDPAGSSAAGFDPSVPRPISAPPPESMRGVPNLTTGENEGVEPQPQFAGGVEAPPHSEANETDGGEDEKQS